VTTDAGRWDVVVVGAGPAGAAAALGALDADPGLRVLMLDRSDFPRDKCCGDGIAPHVFDALAAVGVHDAGDGWAPLRTLELARGTTRVTDTMARPVHVIPRSVFDARLVASALDRGAVLARHRVSALRRHGNEVVLDDRVSARVVVGADGAHSTVRSWVTHRRRGRRALAIRGYAPTPAGRRGTQVIRYGGGHQPAYAWAFDRGDGLSNVGYGEPLPARGSDGALPSRARLLGRLDELIPGAGAGATDWRGHHLPLSSLRWHQPDGPVLLVGDAAGLVNPMTGEGIYYAVATGILAGRAAAGALAGQAAADAGRVHRRAVRRLLGRHLRHTWTAARLTEVPAVVDAGIRAASRDRHAFDALVEIGLGDGRITPRLAAGIALALPTRSHTSSTDHHARRS
jgi:geranylgeranyl reductase family protein